MKASTSSDHSRTSKKIIAAASFSVFLAALGYYASTLPATVFSFTWRPYGFVIGTALVIHIAILIIMLTRSSYRKGPFYWFVGLVMSDLAHLTFTLLSTLNTSASGEAFWQGLWPVGWIPIAVCIAMFVFTYVDDTDIPKNVATWASLLLSFVGLEYLATSTNLIESHIPNHSQLLPWGYQSDPGKLSPLIYLWIYCLVVVLLFVLWRSYRSAASRIAKRQRLIFLIALGQYMALGMIFDFLIYSFAPNAYPVMTPVYSTIFSCLVGYGIIKYGLFQLNPTSLAKPILDNLSEAVIGVNEDMQIEFVNNGAGVIFGHTTMPLVGRQLHELFRTKDYEAIEAGLRQGNGEYINEDSNILTLKEERLIPVTLAARPAQNEQGKTVGYILVIQNLTELKKKSLELAHEKASVERKVVERTKELHEERARLRASIESLELGFLLVDATGKLVIQNKALQKILGLADTANSLATVASKLQGFDLEAECRKSQHEHTVLIRQEVSVGSRILRIFVTPVEVSDQNATTVLGSVVLMEDITEAKVLERSRDEFFSIASHELRTPLTAIRGNTSMMLEYFGEALKNNPELVEMINDVHGSSTNLIAIVNDFLDMSRLEQGKMSFAPTSFAIEPLIERVVYEMKAVLKEKKLTIELNTKELNGLPQVYADAERLKQVLYNLIGNASKFTEKGAIRIHSKVAADFLKITVSDEGRGIALDAQKFLFHKFQQASSSILTRDTTRGTGLGLYISRLIIEDMGGTLVLDSSEEGVGSSFSFTVPLADKKAPTKQPQVMPTTTEKPADKLSTDK